jgi:pimeloyl-ACP methyl ester carboxylesterase
MPKRQSRLAAACATALTLAAVVSPSAAPAHPSTFDPLPYLRPADLVAVGSRKLNLYCVGAGSPVVILEAGLGDDMTTWRYVQPALARRTRVCAYDRAGMGFSDFASSPRDALAVTSDLGVLLRNAGVRPPYVMVGSSVGGLYSLMFAERYRTDVATLLLVEPAEFHNWDFRPVAPAVAAGLAVWRRQSALCLAAVRRRPLMPGSPTYRACVPDAKSVGPACEAGGQVCALAKLQAAHRAGRDYFTDFVSEQQSWGERTAAEVQSSLHSLGADPMIVLTGAKTFEEMSGVPQDQKVAAERLWIGMHARLAALSSNGRNAVIADSGHVMQYDDPDAIVAATDALLDQVQPK